MLKVAVSLENASLVKLLLKAGADVNAVDEQDHCHTALHKCLEQMRNSKNQSTLLEILRTLLEHGASVRETVSVKLTPLPIFYENCVKYLYTDGEFSEDSRTALSLLCAHGADINEVVDGGLTMLLCVVRSGNLSATRALLENGADIKAVTTKGNSALYLCLSSSQALNKKLDMAKLLIKEKVKLTTCDSHGKNALEMFLLKVMSQSTKSKTSKEEKELVHLLIGSGVKVEFISRETLESNIIYKLTESGRFKLAKYLVCCGYAISREPWVADFSVEDDNRDPVLKHDKCRKFMKLVIDRGQEVPSLSLCCRNAIRNQLLLSTGGTDIRQRVSELGLPVPVTEFLQFQHEYEELILQRSGNEKKIDVDNSDDDNDDDDDDEDDDDSHYSGFNTPVRKTLKSAIEIPNFEEWEKERLQRWDAWDFSNKEEVSDTDSSHDSDSYYRESYSSSEIDGDFDPYA